MPYVLATINPSTVDKLNTDNKRKVTRMKKILLIGLTVMDYFGYYINWNKSILALSVLVPVMKAIQSFFSNPIKEVNKIKDKLKH